LGYFNFSRTAQVPPDFLYLFVLVFLVFCLMALRSVVAIQPRLPGWSPSLVAEKSHSAFLMRANLPPDMQEAEVFLVIPCYREAARLPNFLPSLLTELESHAVSAVVQIVDDGSPVAEQEALRSFIASLRKEHPILLEPLCYAQNRGKGYAIRAGWAKAGECNWLAFVDADGAVPPEETVRVIERAIEDPSMPAIICGVRQDASGTAVHRQPLRAFGSRVFQAWVSAWLRLPIHDTQCGLKLLSGSFYRAREKVWKEEHYAFDLELLLIAQKEGLSIAVVPVRWREQADTRLGFRSAAVLFLDAWRLRRLRKKEYRS
jgi:dolichyl-phosphate beta-glucosyltransferase